MDDDDLSRRNASVRTDDVPLPPDLRARLLADAADVARPIPKIRRRPFAWFGGLADLSAALAGL